MKRETARRVGGGAVAELVKELCLKAAVELRPDVRVLLQAALAKDNPAPARKALEQLLANAEIAGRERLPLCQDCGYPTVFAELGPDIQAGAWLDEAIQAGVRAAYEEGPLRQSVIRDAWRDRVTPERTVPATIHYSFREGPTRLTVVLKGGGSDNASRLAMFPPTAGEDRITAFVVEVVKELGANACPPLFIGVGIGGSFDTVTLLSKKALLPSFAEPNPDPGLAALEDRLLAAVNGLGIGPAGLGGETTALAVSVLTDKAHIGALPVAVNLGCNSVRSAAGELLS